MNRTALALTACLALALPAAVVAQPRILVGAGITSPIGSLSDVAEGGYHVFLGVKAGIPTLPVAIQVDGAYHTMGEAQSTLEPTNVLGGGLNVVFTLPGVALVPYVLGGVGRYRIRSGTVASPTEETTSGFQTGFGVDLGAMGFGGFAEIRFVQVNGASGNVRFVPVTVGLRL